MFPSEMEILMAIAVNKDTGKKLLMRPMDVMGEYIGYLYNSLVNRGYLKGNKSKGYQLTSIGREALLGFLHKKEAGVKGTIKKLQQLGIAYSQEMEKKGKEAMGSSREAKQALSSLFTK